MRKVIQIATTMHPGGVFQPKWAVIHALCDDGSIWSKSPWSSKPGGKKWYREEAIPQDEPPIQSTET